MPPVVSPLKWARRIALDSAWLMYDPDMSRIGSRTIRSVSTDVSNEPGWSATVRGDTGEREGRRNGKASVCLILCSVRKKGEEKKGGGGRKRAENGRDHHAHRNRY